MKSKLQTSLDQNKKVITVEICPPKGCDFSKFKKNALAVKDYVTAYNVTDNQRSVMRISPLVAARTLIDNGLEPIYQIACRDRNRLAIQSDLLGAYAMGVKNVLALTGDHVINGDYRLAKPVFDLDSVQLLYTISNLMKGEDLSGNKLSGTPDFYVGGVVNPASSNIDIHLWRLKEKTRFGAKFFQTQAIFDEKIAKDFVDSVKGLNIKIILGVILIKSVKMAEFLNKNVPGLHVPDWVIKELKSTKYEAEAGVKITSKLIKDFLKVADGVHVMAIHEEFRLPSVFKNI